MLAGAFVCLLLSSRIQNQERAVAESSEENHFQARLQLAVRQAADGPLDRLRHHAYLLLRCGKNLACSNRVLESISKTESQETFELFCYCIGETSPEGLIKLIGAHCDHINFCTKGWPSNFQHLDRRELLKVMGHSGRSSDRNRSFFGKRYRREIVAEEEKWLQQSSLGSALFADLALTDLDEAIAQARALKDPWARREAFRGIAQTLAQQNPREALTWAESLDSYAQRHDAMRMVIFEWAKTDPQACAAALIRYPLSLKTLPLFEQLANEWGHKDPKGAINWVANNVSGKAQSDVMRMLAKSIPITTAVREFTKAGLLETDGDLSEEVFGRWFGEDLESAIGWMESESSQALLGPALASWSRIDAEAASAYMEMLDGTEQLSADSLIAFGAGLAEQNPEAGLGIMKRAAGRTEGNFQLRQEASKILRKLSRDQPELAGSWMLELANTPILDDQPGRLVIRNVVEQWVAMDRGSMEAWAEAIPLSQTRDRVMNLVANAMLDVDKQTVFEWAAQIVDPESRKNSVANLVRKLPRDSGAMGLLARGEFSGAERTIYQKWIREAGHQ